MIPALSIRIPTIGREEISVRKTLLGAMALSLSALALPAAAQDSDNVYLQTTVPAYCQTTPWAGSASIALGELADGNGFLRTTFAGTPSLTSSANYYCNAPAKLTLSATPLSNPITVVDTTSFVNRVDYTATLTWASVTGSTNSQATAPTEISSLQANTGLMNLVVSSPVIPSGDRPIAGSYTGQVTLTVTLQP